MDPKTERLPGHTPPVLAWEQVAGDDFVVLDQALDLEEFKRLPDAELEAGEGIGAPGSGRWGGTRAGIG